MPLRVISYDGAGYRAQLLQDDRYPVITLVLNFDSKPWGKVKSLYDRINIPEELKPFVNDYRINVFDVSFLSEEQLSLFKSDFKIIADYFVHRRTNPDYRPTDPERFKHTDELLKLFTVMTNDSRFVQTLQAEGKRRPENMCEVLDRIEEKGRLEGEKIGEKKGKKIGEKKGEKKLAELITKLVSAGRNDDIYKAASDTRYRNKLYKEFQIV